eukprot:tig00021761_g23449.t1
MEKLMRMGIRQQLQNAYPNRQINEEDVENAFTLRKEIMIRDFDQWAMTAFDLKQPGVAKMLEEYYPELLERITNMIEQDIEIQRFDKYQKVFFPMNYDDLVMKWARERGWIKTMEEIEKENLLGPAGRYAKETAASEEGRPAKEGKEKGEKAPKADKTALPGDGPTEHIEMTKKKEQSVKKALGIDLQEKPRDEAQTDVDEKKQVLRQIAQYRRSFGAS